MHIGTLTKEVFLKMFLEVTLKYLGKFKLKHLITESRKFKLKLELWTFKIKLELLNYENL